MQSKGFSGRWCSRSWQAERQLLCSAHHANVRPENIPPVPAHRVLAFADAWLQGSLRAQQRELVLLGGSLIGASKVCTQGWDGDRPQG